MSICALCKPNLRDHTSTDGSDGYIIDCPICGKATITEEAFHDITSRRIPLHLLKGYIRYQNEINNNKTVRITSENIKSIINDPIIPRNVAEQIERILLFFNTRSKYAGQIIDINYKNDSPLSFSKESDELVFLLKELHGLNLISFTDLEGSGQCKLLLKGWDKINEIIHSNVFSKQCFVAMSFDEDMEIVYEEAISRAIRDAGYSPYRIDKQEHSELIPYKMLAEIRKSRFTVADFTHHKGGVYFEAGCIFRAKPATHSG